MENETWLPVTGYENLYEVSNLGRVRSLVRKTPAGVRGGRVLRPQKQGAGYLFVKLYKNKEQKFHLVHRLVGQAFIPNPLGLPIINHKNEVKTDNRAENLEWCSNYYNCTYGSLSDIEREVFRYDLDGEFVVWYPSTAEAARQTGISQGSIAQCARGECKTQGGYQWSYVPALFLDATDEVKYNTLKKHVFQYTLDGRFVKEWPSTKEVQRQTGWDNSTICACCNGKRKQANGFRWFYSYQGTNLNKPTPSHTEQAGLF